MADLRQALALINSASMGGGMVMGSPELAEAAKIYAQACTQLNERLARCDQLILAGLRSEALRQAQIDPDLLRRYGELDLLARQRWDEIAHHFTMSIASRIHTAAAHRLNQAFADEAVAAELLKQQRILALTRAPLRDRLAIVRLLARTEPHNVAWIDDLRAYEQARIDEIRQEAIALRNGNNWELARTLREELAYPHWQIPVPLDLLDIVAEADHNMNRRAAGSQIAVIVKRLQQAIDKKDLFAARTSTDELKSLQQTFALPEGDVLLEPLRKASQWIRTEETRRAVQKDYKQAIQDLEVALREGLEWWYVQERHHEVVTYNLPLPAEILKQYNTRKQWEEQGRWRWIYIGSLGAGAFVGISLLLYAVL